MMDKEFINDFARNTLLFVKRFIDDGIEPNWGGKRQNRWWNNKVSESLGILPKDWFKFCEQNKSVDYFYGCFKKIKNETMLRYGITRFVKTRVAFSDGNYLDLIGFKKNPDRYDKVWDNEINGYKFDLKGTYLHGDYDTIEKVENDPVGFIKYTYSISSGKSNGSERADIGFLNNRFFVISHSLRENKNKFLVESGCKGRYNVFNSLLNEFSESNVFKIQAVNNSDSELYWVNSAILIIYEDDNGEIKHKLLRNP